MHVRRVITLSLTTRSKYDREIGHNCPGLWKQFICLAGLGTVQPVHATIKRAWLQTVQKLHRQFNAADDLHNRTLLTIHLEFQPSPISILIALVQLSIGCISNAGSSLLARVVVKNKKSHHTTNNGDGNSYVC